MGAATAVASHGTPSVRKFCEGMMPSERRAFFRSDDALKVFPAWIVHQERRRLKKLLKRLESDVPSATWLDAADRHNEEFPPGKTERPTPHGSRMILSTISGRYTPPNNLSDEDGLDAMTELEVDLYEGPSSCGSVISWKLL